MALGGPESPGLRNLIQALLELLDSANELLDLGLLLGDFRLERLNRIRWSNAWVGIYSIFSGRLRLGRLSPLGSLTGCGQLQAQKDRTQAQGRQ